MAWKKISTCEPKQGKMVFARIRHINEKLNLADQIVEGYMGDDNFYLKDGGELSWNWNILEWSENYSPSVGQGG